MLFRSALARLRVIYPNLMRLDYDNRRTQTRQELDAPVMTGREFIVWSILNWRILREEEIGSYYEKMVNNTNAIHRSWQDCVQRLLVRGLIVVGTGDTEYDALYDLLACRFIIPIGAAWPLRILSFSKLTFLEGISWKITRRLFHIDARSSCEKKVIRLARCRPQ